MRASGFALLLLATFAVTALAKNQDDEAAPDLIIRFGYRSVLSLVGIVMLIAGVWHVDRTWDEKGSAAYKKEAAVKGRADQKFVEKESKFKIPEADLDAAFPFPYAFIIGWNIFGISHMFDANDLTGADISSPNVWAMLFSAALSVIASVPMGDAVRNRKAKKKGRLGMLFVLTWMALAYVTGYESQWKYRNNGLNSWLAFTGAFTIILSMKILWKFRKMGDMWEQFGKPNPKPVVYNMGGPFFVFGFFLFWLSANAMNIHQYSPAPTCEEWSHCFIPIYFNIRTFLAFFAGCGMVPVVMCLDYAHDEGAEYVGWGTDGTYFGRFWESPTPFVLFWTTFGLAGFFDVNNGLTLSGFVKPWTVLVLCVSLGIDAGILIQTALYEGDMARKSKYSIPFVLMFAILGVTLGLTPDLSGLNADGLAMPLGVFGAILIIMGQKTVFADRKRGDYFMQNNEAPNPNPVVYSAGEPLFMAGWIAISWANSLNF